MNRTKHFSMPCAMLMAVFPLVAGAQAAAAPIGSAEAAAITAPAVPPASRELSSGGVNTTSSEAGVDALAERVPASPAERLKPVMRNDITYLCGGVGEEEAAYIRQQASSYDLMLTFAARDGAYLADVNVDIADASGNRLLQARCDSPMMLVDLPRAGNYRIRADARGHVIRRSIKVAAGRKTGQHLATAVLTWPQQVAEHPAVRSEASGAGTASGTTGSGNAEGAGKPGGAGRGTR
ncbi:hypothetical protein [Noviherbaspirillum aerium]|uniref:hypothetical protein n=1 Tax=Noviherbaspirillum aerium TaxID=2588497 RepID=UPI00124C64BB|nr:hypothetical protein [Noviherbaspirillum aerium]